MTRLDQSRASENICWLINHDIHPLFRLNRSFSSLQMYFLFQGEPGPNGIPGEPGQNGRKVKRRVLSFDLLMIAPQFYSQYYSD